MSPDVAGIWRALAKLPNRSPQQRSLDYLSARTYQAASSMQAGRRYRTRSLPRSTSPLPSWHSQPRDQQGRWCRVA